MLSESDNRRLTQTGPGTPMGTLLREYWWPVMRADKVMADGAPVKVRLMGEDYVAWRDTNGRLGFFDEHCPHRGVSLALARNEQCGLRCIMHAWKIDVEGNVVETPNEREEGARLKRIKVGKFPVREAGGMVWVYVGGRKTPPPFPAFPFSNAATIEPLVCEINCNWFQVMETLWDPSHVGILHYSEPEFGAMYEGAENPAAGDRPKKYIFFEGMREEPWGFSYRTSAETDPATGGYWTPTVMPCWVFISGVSRTEHADRVVFAHTPVDDTHMLLFEIPYNMHRKFGQMGEINSNAVGQSKHNFRLPTMDPEKTWGQNREAMKKGSFSGLGVEFGVAGLLNQDVAVAESMGQIANRTREHLGPADHAVIKGRQVFLKALLDYERSGLVLGIDAKVDNIGVWKGDEYDHAEAPE